MNYITITHMLERIHPKTFVMNPPAAVRNAPEKILVTEFPDLMPPTLVTRDRARSPPSARARQHHRQAALRQWRRRRVLHQEGDHNLASLIELFEQSFREPFMVQRYLPDVRKGDKRIIIVDGEPVGAINRVPAEGRGALQHACRRPPRTVDLTARDREICARIGRRSRSAT
jgi:glutathione synthase